MEDDANEDPPAGRSPPPSPASPGLLHPTDRPPTSFDEQKINGALPPTFTERLRQLVGRLSRLLESGIDLSPAASPDPDIVQCGDVSLDIANRVATRSGHKVRLTRREFGLLHSLIRRRGAVASRKELLHEVWGSTSAVGPRTVDTHIARLRRKLEKVPSRPRYIRTAVTSGYSFRPDVSSPKLTARSSTGSPG